MTGKEPDEVVADLRETATTAVKVDLALRAVAEAEGIECTDEDLEQEYAQVAERLELKAEEFAVSSSARSRCRRYARTSRSARRSTGCSSGSRSSMRTVDHRPSRSRARRRDLLRSHGRGRRADELAADTAGADDDDNEDDE